MGIRHQSAELQKLAKVLKFGYSIFDYNVFDLTTWMPRLICIFVVCIGIMQMSSGCCQRYEPRYEKSGLRGFRPGPTQTRLHARGLKFRI